MTILQLKFGLHISRGSHLTTHFTPRLQDNSLLSRLILPPAPDPVAPAAIRRAEIEAELTAIDAASARPLRAILAATTSGGAADPADVAKLAELEAQAKALRTELASLEA